MFICGVVLQYACTLKTPASVWTSYSRSDNHCLHSYKLLLIKPQLSLFTHSTIYIRHMFYKGIKVGHVLHQHEVML